MKSKPIELVGMHGKQSQLVCARGKQQCGAAETSEDMVEIRN